MVSDVNLHPYIELLSVSDARVGCLLAEAQLLTGKAAQA